MRFLALHPTPGKIYFSQNEAYVFMALTDSKHLRHLTIKMNVAFPSKALPRIANIIEHTDKIGNSLKAVVGMDAAYHYRPSETREV